MKFSDFFVDKSSTGKLHFILIILYYEVKLVLFCYCNTPSIFIIEQIYIFNLWIVYINFIFEY
ncbi:hypothetical protein GLOIN_2v1725747 [Rhizophagus irregularis DAOM 181602=DAOM 197198]|uniref:Uncharacterized protein n=1 Tax=Rhizophagus irregularis (strain DAOM 181602 / DAOM 197198 / MUCL 43194) TaxID=747089 RepID=A0A2P4P0U3_RHIID|nr:hypothetical protein GLOIN_2v1725747 [Rhizophagus irregularis DAOM 181602=DAOM 197198]POG59007.1 hypothetical protein GLOIN_2v1725747 [Rhizophagus irregularis DAOM 181602=DAOM 197198]|eukprot:XP_025165873.1 hypothetical protein GLOIN_2v1725747 [Rhizophagus irregularis DAOM 181602=DAOM 197198]